MYDVNAFNHASVHGSIVLEAVGDLPSSVQFFSSTCFRHTAFQHVKNSLSVHLLESIIKDMARIV